MLQDILETPGTVLINFPLRKTWKTFHWMLQYPLSVFVFNRKHEIYYSKLDANVTTLIFKTLRNMIYILSQKGEDDVPLRLN